MFFFLLIIIVCMLIFIENNLIISLLYLTLAFFFVVILCILLDAELLAWFMFIITIGTISIFFLFVILSIDIFIDKKNNEKNFLKILCSFFLSFFLLNLYIEYLIFKFYDIPLYFLI